ncbi:MAG TPA: TraR/DksA C4-type zinc finger protein [Thermoguttaceae bacterium]|nr:TraR/DksA C4-type zinc finger protein [Thermoguttaceae bacterium]
MSRGKPYVELRCAQCPWTELCGPEDAARWLHGARKLRAASEPEWEILYEVLRSAAGQLACPQCGAKGLAVGPAREDTSAWPGDKTCSACGQAIPRDRAEALPDATLCAACQRREEQGRSTAEIEYCPKCGAPMKLRPSRSGGVTRYVMACTGDPPCRLGRN